MFKYWSARVAIGQTPKPTEVPVACGTTIHAARAAVRRYKSGIARAAPAPHSGREQQHA
jgi:hypothetical protein